MKAIAINKSSNNNSTIKHFGKQQRFVPNKNNVSSGFVDNSLIQRKSHCACGGGCPRCREAETSIQSKLRIGAPGDKYEQEADRMADLVMRIAEPTIQGAPTSPLAGGSSLGDREIEQETSQTKTISEQITPLVQRQVAEEEKGLLQAKGVSHSTPAASPKIAANINAMQGSGQSLSEPVQRFFEPRFGHDLSQVRVHTDVLATETAQALNAKAFTLGKDVFFGKGEFTPGTPAGLHLLAHELTHFVQQKPTLSNHDSPVRLKENPRIQRQTLHSSCAAHEDDINESRTAAQEFTEDTVRFLERVRDRIGRTHPITGNPVPIPPYMIRWIRNAFGDVDSLDLPHPTYVVGIPALIERFGRIAEAFRNESRSLRCDTSNVLQQQGLPSNFCDLHGAFVLEGVSEFRNTLFLCPNFMSAENTRTSRGLTLLHEMAHSVLRIGHQGGRKVVFGCDALELSFEQAKRNAYAYDKLAECIQQGLTADETPPTAAESPEEDRRWRLIARGGISREEESELRAFASLGAELSLRTGSTVVFNPIFGFQILTIPSGDFSEVHMAAAMVDIGLRIQQPLTGAYFDAQAGAFVGARFEPGAATERTAGFGATLGAGWRFEKIEIGGEARALFGDTNRLLFIGRVGGRF